MWVVMDVTRTEHVKVLDKGTAERFKRVDRTMCILQD